MSSFQTKKQKVVMIMLFGLFVQQFGNPGRDKTQNQNTEAEYGISEKGGFWD